MEDELRHVLVSHAVTVAEMKSLETVFSALQVRVSKLTVLAGGVMEIVSDCEVLSKLSLSLFKTTFQE